jgi:hypothetical protein
MTELAGTIRGVAVLDLTPITSAEELQRITSIEGVALILVPESLVGTLSGIPQVGVAATVPIPDGARPQVHTGALTMGGDGLASEDAADQVLIVTGLLALTTPVTKVAFKQVIVTGLVLAPEGSESALGAGLTRMTGGVEYYRKTEGQRINVMSGQSRVSGQTLANEGGNPDDILVLAGQSIITGDVPSVGYQRILVGGQVVAPRAAEPLLAPVLSIHGQLAWYDGEPRFFIGSDTLGSDFFDFVEEPIGIGVVGTLTIAPEVTLEQFRGAVSDIVLMGVLRVPPHLLGAAQFLTSEKHGVIAAVEDTGGG